MNANDIIKFFSKVKFAEEVVETFGYAKMEDGTVLQAETFEPGQVVNKVNEDGTTEVLIDGEYVITIAENDVDITKKVIIANGVIDTIEDVVEEPEIEETPLEDKNEPTPETEMEDEIIVNHIEVKIMELEARISAIEEKLNQTLETPVEEPATEMEVELEKLDGAPVEFNAQRKNKNEKILDIQDKFLSKLYKNR